MIIEIAVTIAFLALLGFAYAYEPETWLFAKKPEKELTAADRFREGKIFVAAVSVIWLILVIVLPNHGGTNIPSIIMLAVVFLLAVIPWREVKEKKI